MAAEQSDAQEGIAQLTGLGFSSEESLAALALYPAVDRAATFLLEVAPEERTRWTAAHEQLCAMGFPSETSCTALERTRGHADRAMDWIIQKEEREARAEKAKSVAAANPGAVATPAAPAVLVTADYSDSDVREQLLVHRAVFNGNSSALGEYCTRGLANARDHRGLTPLLLAHQLGRLDVAAFLLNRGADPRLRTPGGWSLLQQAAMQGQQALALDVHLHTLLLRQAEWEARHPALLRALERMPDFTMEISWEVTSWLPLVGRLAPRDTFQLWKKGGKLRLDSHVRGVSSNLQVQRGLLSFLFISGSVWEVDHVTKEYSDALAAFRQPNFDDMELHVAHLMRRDSAQRSEVNTDQVAFKQKKTLLRQPKHEKVAGWNCKVMQMSGLRFVEIATTAPPREDPLLADDPNEYAALASSGSVGGRPALDAATYFDADELVAYNKRRLVQERLERKKQRRMREAINQLDASASPAPASAVASSSALPAPAAAAAAASSSSSHALSSDESDDDSEIDESSAAPSPSTVPAADGVTVKTTVVDATLWLSAEYPLPVAHLLVLLDLLSPANSNLAKLRDLLAVRLPLEADGRAPFPVRVSFPIVSQVHAEVTFCEFKPQRRPEDIADTIFDIPKEFKERR